MSRQHDEHGLTSFVNEPGGSLESWDTPLAGNRNLRELPLTLGSIPALTCIEIGGTTLNPQVVRAILEQCAAVRQVQGLVILPHRLQTWETAGNSQVDLSDIESFTDDDKGILNEWLVRLERTNDFEGNREPLANTVCEILSSMTQDEALKTLFLAHMAVNIQCCEDRAAQSFNELYTSWKVQGCSKNAPLQERLSIMIRGAKTLALRNAIAARIKSREQATGREELEAVEIYLFYEIALKEPLDLLSIIQTMSFAAIGQRDWIDQNVLITTVQKSYIDHLIDIPAFAKVLAEDEKFQEMWGPQESALRKRIEILEDSAQTEDVSKKLLEQQYLSDSKKIMAEHKQKYKETVVNWLASFKT